MLIKTVAQTILIYMMSCFKWPNSLCDDMTNIVWKFWWVKKGMGEKWHGLAGISYVNPRHWEQGRSYMLGMAPPKFLKISFYYIEIFNISIISPQKWDLPPFSPTIWVGPIMFLKKLSNLSSSYREYIISQIHFLW